MKMKSNLLIKCTAVFLSVCFLQQAAFAADTTFGEESDYMSDSESVLEEMYKYELSDGSSLADGEDLGEFEDDIDFAVGLGFMQCDEKGKFNPNASVSYEEMKETLGKYFTENQALVQKSDGKVKFSDAVELFIIGLGYDKHPDYSSVNYMADKTGLLKNLEYKPNAMLTRKEFARLLINGLDIELWGRAISPPGAVDAYMQMKDKTVLSEYLGMVKADGFLNGIEGLNLTADREVRKNTVEIDGVSYAVGKFSQYRLLGSRVSGYAYIDKEDGSLSIAYIHRDKKEKRLEIKISDIETADGNTITYNSGGKIKNISVKNFKNIVYNGTHMTNTDFLQAARGKHGTAVFSASSKNGNYDVMIVKEYKDFFVSGIDSQRKNASIEYNMTYDGKRYIDFNDDMKSVYIYDTAFNRIGSDKIKKGIISVYQNEDKSYIEAVFSNRSIMGNAESVSDKEIKIDNIDYKIAEEYALASAQNPDIAKKPSAGMKGKFYISFDGYIGGYEQTKEYAYAIFQKIYLSNEGDENSAVIRFFDETGEWVTMAFTDKVTLDGQKMKSYDMYNKLWSDKKNLVGNLIRYKYNANNQIYFIDTLNDTEYEANDTERLVYSGNFKGVQTWTEGRSFPGVPYGITSETKIFKTPKDLDKEKDYKVLTTKSTEFENQKKIDIDFYTADTMYRCSAAHIKAKEMTEEEKADAELMEYMGSTFIAISSVALALNSDEEEVFCIYGTQFGKTYEQRVSYMTDTDTYEEWSANANPLKRSDIIRFKLDSDNVIYGIDRICENGTIPQEDFIKNPDYNREYAAGTVIEIIPNWIKVKVGGSEMVWNLVESVFCRYDKTTNTFEQISWSEVNAGDRVLIYGAVKYGGGVLVNPQ